MAEVAEVARVASFLGGPAILKKPVNDQIDAHKLILEGIPASALLVLAGHLRDLQKTGAFEKALGMSLRTFQRRKDDPTKLLSTEQSSRAWKFAEILAKATEVFGSQEEAERWLERPAMGLDGHRPVDLMATSAGTELVETFLEQLEHGVYV
jgi:putative toxin-antitoxin system antitoxin component (TIGR02293 family)